MKKSSLFSSDFSRRKFLSSAGKGLGLMAMSSAAVGTLFERLDAATRKVAHLSPMEVAADEDFWA
ncbi:MAG: hypothetical protein OEQ28_10350, partial [Acidobacteriota bacterium]|nr:hypothetical protein [Acidobacteriota bacterium]